jgi:ornithine cyclodeaminase/alanine dehydrogenase-like protein (mu-crystallin family)
VGSGTLFNSLGLGIEDVAVAAQVVNIARAQGIGEELTFLT